MNTFEKYWWQDTPNASRLCKEIVQALFCGRQVIFHHPQHLPWQNTFCKNIEKLILEQESERTLKIVAAESIPDTLAGLGDYLLKNFCKPDLRTRFRSAMGYADFLANHTNGNTLSTTYLLIENASAKQVETWIPFLEEYHEKLGQNNGCTFLLTTSADTNLHAKGIECIDYEEEITDYDCLIFYLILAGECKDCPPALRQYLGELTGTIAKKDVELGAACVKQGNSFLKNPLEILQYLSNDGRCSFPEEETTIRSAIWMTQVKMLFPIIENFRQRFLERYQERIQKQLPHNNSFGEPVTDYHDVELGLIWHFFYDHDLQVSDKDYNDFRIYRDARNNLAHIEPLNLKDVLQVIQTTCKNHPSV